MMCRSMSGQRYVYPSFTVSLYLVSSFLDCGCLSGYGSGYLHGLNRCRLDVVVGLLCLHWSSDRMGVHSRFLASPGPLQRYLLESSF